MSNHAFPFPEGLFKGGAGMIQKCFLMTSFLLVSLNLLSGTALASHEVVHGRVGMQGSIVDTACAIAMADRTQTIDMGTITTGKILHDGQGAGLVFHLGLVNCSLTPVDAGRPDWSRFQVTFDGPADGSLFAVQGAEGVGLEISDESGHVAMPGQPMPAGALTPGGKILTYRIHLRSNSHQLRAGDFQVTIRFKVDYY